MNIAANFPWILVTLSFITGAIAIIDKCYLAKRRKLGASVPVIADYAISFFPIILLVLFLRTVVAQLYWVPTGSLEPTVNIGELTFVTQYDYAIHLPMSNKSIINTGEPKRGDIIVFHWPVNENANLIKRLVGLPGDDISYNEGVLTINGNVATQTYIKNATDVSSNGAHWGATIYQENLSGFKHDIFRCDNKKYCSPNKNFNHLIIPEGQYFFMGDNRNNSDDSRHWGFVPKENLVGKLRFVVLSWDSELGRVRWDRIGTTF